MADSIPELDLRDIPDARPFLPTAPFPWWGWLIIATCAILAVTAAWLIFRKKSSSKSSLHNAYLEACQALQQASSIIQPITLSTAVSLTIRRYLAATCADPSLFETHEEFLARHGALTGIPDDLRQEISRHFALIAQLKYAPRSIDYDLTSLVPTSRSIIDRLHALTPLAATPRP